MILSFFYKYSIYLLNVSDTQQRYRVFLQATNFGPSYGPSSGLIQEQHFMQFRMDTLHYIADVYIYNVFHIKF